MPLLTPEEQGELKDILKFEKPTDLWRFADTQIDMTPRIADAFNKAAAGDREARNACDKIAEAFYGISGKVKDGLSRPISKMILVDISWDGYVDFNNDAQMERVKKYIGNASPPASKGQTP